MAGERIAPQDWMTAPATRRVMTAFADAGVEARFVGGCVRDALLGRTVTDIDIATPAPPDRATAILEAAGIAVHPTGVKHGTVTAVADHRPFEITTLRRDVENFGRHARVEFTDDWQADAARRDFTMNAISCGGDGALFDYFGGIADARAGRVRFVGSPEDRIREDVLRLLRLFRFQAHYGKTPLDNAALAAAEKMAPMLVTLSGERIRNETLRLLVAPDPLPVLTSMRERGVLQHFLPEATQPQRLAGLVKLENSIPLVETMNVAADAIRRLAALLTADAAIARAVAERLRLSNEERDRLVALAAFPPIDRHSSNVERHRRIYRDGAAIYFDRVLLSWAASVDDAKGWAPLLADAHGWRNPQLPVRGADAIALGVPAGPRVGKLIEAVETWWIDGDFRVGRDACLAKLKELAADDRR
jgi:poly(A) polymerase